MRNLPLSKYLIGFLLLSVIAVTGVLFAGIKEIHLTVQFNEKFELPGPLVIGAGRHCGFGLMAGIDDID